MCFVGLAQGTFTWPSGATYTGAVDAGCVTGRGKKCYPNGDVYTGDFVDGLRSGRGVLDYRNGTVYDGEWRNDVRNGIGRQTYVNRDMYSGKWVSDKRCGQGTCVVCSFLRAPRTPSLYVERRVWARLQAPTCMRLVTCTRECGTTTSGTARCVVATPIAGGACMGCHPHPSITMVIVGRASMSAEMAT